MQYIARSEMQVAGANGVLRHVSPGDALPEFASWPYVLRMAHLHNATVEEVGAQYNANLDVLGGMLSYNGHERTPLELVDHVSADPVDVTPEPVEAVEVEAMVTPSAGTFPCTVCDKVFFRPSRLAKHMQKHP